MRCNGSSNNLDMKEDMHTVVDTVTWADGGFVHALPSAVCSAAGKPALPCTWHCHGSPAVAQGPTPIIWPVTPPNQPNTLIRRDAIIVPEPRMAERREPQMQLHAGTCCHFE